MTMMKKFLALLGLYYIASMANLTGLAHAGITIQHWRTANGARVYFVETHALPILDVQVDFVAGSVFDPPGKEGVSALTHTVIDLGAGKFDETEIGNQLADVGANLSGTAEQDRINLVLRTLAMPDKRNAALEVLRLVLQEPRFDANVFQREQKRSIAGLKEALTRPETLANRGFLQALYPKHPYGRLSTPETLAAINLSDVTSFYRQYYAANNAVITLVGDVSRAEAEQITNTLTQGLAVAPQLPTLPPAPELPSGGKTQIAHPASQAHLFMGVPAIERGNLDVFPLVVGNYTLGGGGFVSRLMQEVREKRGLAYSVFSYFQPLRQAGPFIMGLQTKKEQAAEAEKLVKAVFADFAKNGPTEAELKAAKANLMGSFPLRLDNNKKILENVAAIGFYQLPLDWLDKYQERIQRLTVADIKAAFARRVKAENLVTVQVGGE